MGKENQRPGFKTRIDELFGYKGTGLEIENFLKVILTFFKGLIKFDTNDVASRVRNGDPATGPRPSHAPFAFLEAGRSNVMPDLRSKFRPAAADATPPVTTAPVTPSAAASSTSAGTAVDPNRDFKKAADNKPPCPSTMSVQMTGSERNANNTLVALGKLVLTDGNGKEHTFAFKSGGWGRYGDNSMLPGLKGDKQGVNYQLDWDSLILKSKDLKPSMLGPDGTGSWIALGSNREYTDRGQPLGSKEKGFFGIHVDGPNNPAAGAKGNEGSEGCIVLNQKDADAFFAVLQSIPVNQRPQTLAVQNPAIPAIGQINNYTTGPRT